jgi:hypothetical protein
MFQTDAGRTARTRPLSAAAWPLVIERQRLPRLGLSTLNSMAFGLAVYASPGSLPHHDARLASSCWSSSTGRGFHPQGSDERFQSCRLHLILLSQASWRNRCNRSDLGETPSRVGVLHRPLEACCCFLGGRQDRCDLARSPLKSDDAICREACRSSLLRRFTPTQVSRSSISSGGRCDRR